MVFFGKIYVTIKEKDKEAVAMKMQYGCCYH